MKSFVTNYLQLFRCHVLNKNVLVVAVVTKSIILAATGS